MFALGREDVFAMTRHSKNAMIKSGALDSSDKKEIPEKTCCVQKWSPLSNLCSCVRRRWKDTVSIVKEKRPKEN
jgi:hypothetical protein